MFKNKASYLFHNNHILTKYDREILDQIFLPKSKRKSLRTCLFYFNLRSVINLQHKNMTSLCSYVLHQGFSIYMLYL